MDVHKINKRLALESGNSTELETCTHVPSQAGQSSQHGAPLCTHMHQFCLQVDETGKALQTLEDTKKDLGQQIDQVGATRILC